MNQKTLQALSILINSPGQYFSYGELAGELSVSTRSIRNYILAIQAYLKGGEANRRLLSMICNRVAFTGCAAEGRRIYLSLLDDGFYTYRLSPHERVWMSSLYLLLSDSFLKLSDFSERFHAGRTTVLKDMEQVKELLRQKGLYLSPLLNKGYLLIVSEPERRRFIEKLITERSDEGLRHPSNFFYLFLAEEGKLKETELVKLILRVEEKYGLNVSDACFDELLLFFTIMAVRLKSGNGLDGGSQGFQEGEAGEIAKELLEGLYQNILPVTQTAAAINGYEIDFLARKLLSCRFCPAPSGCPGSGLKLPIGLSCFLAVISKELSVPFYEDHKMVEMLEAHLESMYKLHSGGTAIENGYVRQMIDEYPEYYEAVKRHKSVLENFCGYEFRDEDMAFVVMYLLVAADKYYMDEVVPRVIICCHTGLGTANFLAKQLKEYYNVRLVAVTSSHKLPELLKKLECDVVISTLPLEEPDRAWLKVSPVLTDKNMTELTNRFAAITKEKGYGRLQKNVESLYAGRKKAGEIEWGGQLTGLGENEILLDYTCQSPEEAIRLSAKPLMENGSIRPRYVEAILDFYHENGAYFVYCPHVALAHAGPEDGVNAFGFSILRLNPGIPFRREEFDPVLYVICMSLTDKKSHTREVLNILNLFSIPENIEILNDLTTAKEVCQFINRKWEETNEK